MVISNIKIRMEPIAKVYIYVYIYILTLSLISFGGVRVASKSTCPKVKSEKDTDRESIFSELKHRARMENVRIS